MMKTFNFTLIIILFISCEKNNPVENNNNCINSGYYLYVCNANGNEIFIIDTDSNIVVDTIYGLDKYICDIAVSRDGRQIFVATQGSYQSIEPKIYSVDVMTKKVQHLINKACNLFDSPDGSIFLITSPTANGKNFIGQMYPHSNTIIFFDTINVQIDVTTNRQSVVFDWNKHIFYGINNDNQLFKYNYCKKNIERVYNNLQGYYALNMMLSVDGRYIYVAGGSIFDLERDSIIGFLGGNHLGSLALSYTGEFLYITDPGHYIHEPMPSGEVAIFNTRFKKYDGTIDVKPAAQPYDCCPITDRIIIMPFDIKIAYVSGWSEYVYILDLITNRVIGRIDLDGFTYPMAIGKKIK